MKHLNELGKKYLDACYSLLKSYKRGKRPYFCPLCCICDICNECAWVVFESIDCEVWIDKNNLFQGIDSDFEDTKTFIKKRIPMLEIWIEALEDKNKCPEIYKK